MVIELVPTRKDIELLTEKLEDFTHLVNIRSSNNIMVEPMKKTFNHHHLPFGRCSSFRITQNRYIWEYFVAGFPSSTNLPLECHLVCSLPA